MRVSLTTGNFSCGSITHVISRTRDWVLNTWQNVFAFMHCSMDIFKVQSEWPKMYLFEDSNHIILRIVCVGLFGDTVEIFRLI